MKTTYPTKHPMRTVQQHSSCALLKKLMSINSSSHDIRGVNKVQLLIKKELESMDFKTQLIPHPQGDFASLLVAQNFTPNDNAKTISLICHADTVFDQNGEFIELKTIGHNFVGPGVADNKGGVVVALQGLRDFLKSVRSHLNLQLICSPNEEVGSLGFTGVFNELGEASDLVLGFEPSTPEGHIINQRLGNRWYLIDTQGLEAHAGRANGEEINAAHELLTKINHLLELKSQCKDLKINIASLEGGSERYNIVCGHARAKIDIRFGTFETRETVHKKIQDLTAHSFIVSKDGQRSRSQFRLDDDCPPLETNEKSAVHAKTYRQIIESIEQRPIQTLQVGGASDVNHLSHPTNCALDGLGPIGGKMHTAEEYIQAASLITRSQALTNFLRLLNDQENH